MNFADAAAELGPGDYVALCIVGRAAERSLAAMPLPRTPELLSTDGNERILFFESTGELAPGEQIELAPGLTLTAFRVARRETP